MEEVREFMRSKLSSQSSKSKIVCITLDGSESDSSSVQSWQTITDKGTENSQSQESYIQAEIPLGTQAIAPLTIAREEQKNKPHTKT